MKKLNQKSLNSVKGGDAGYLGRLAADIYNQKTRRSNLLPAMNGISSR